ncbi:hypothetical protein FIV00_27950 [Labrenzia sp. THAF82]|uniref:hypothetical protein n=1 Tax=Labrenzia sp. THAF82 TaxID=2587861 RepID=UPI001268A6FD|nr:hypothetical protein [Labrenzia sp. THAF82]QFT34360.1 hypothetical protein FIV00_27950 [Labrenzia sp. THAF82]
MATFDEIDPSSYRKDVCDLLIAIEDEVNTQALTVAGIDYWPMLRSIIGHNFEQKILGRNNEVQTELESKLTSLTRLNRGSDPARSAAPASKKKYDLGIAPMGSPQALAPPHGEYARHDPLEELDGYRHLLFSRANRIVDNAGVLKHRDFGRFLSQRSRSDDGAAGSGKVAFIEYENPLSGYHKGANSYVLREEEGFREVIAWQYGPRLRRHGSEVYSYLAELVSKAFQVPKAIFPEVAIWVRYLSNVLGKMELAYRHLKDERDLIVYTTLCLDHVHGTQGLVAACKKLAIPTVEIMHGVGGRHCWPYTHWRQSKSRQYNTLPEYLATWDLTTYTTVLEQKNTGLNGFAPIYLGNQMENYGASETAAEIESVTVKAFDKMRQDYRKIVVFAGQHGKGMIPAVALDAMLKAPKDWLWLIRPHPEVMESADIWAVQLLKSGITNFETTFANGTDINLLVKFSDAVVTYFSTVVLLSKLHGKAAVVLGELGQDVFHDYIEKGEMHLAYTAEDIISKVEQHEPGMQSETRDVYEPGRMFKHIENSIWGPKVN